MPTMFFNPYTGKPRNPKDIVRDPDGKLIVDPQESRIGVYQAERDAEEQKRIDAFLARLDAFCMSEHRIDTMPITLDEALLVVELITVKPIAPSAS